MTNKTSHQSSIKLAHNEPKFFLLIAALIPALFGLVMMFIPGEMLSNSLTSETNLQTLSVTQWAGFGVFTIGLINFFSRNDPGSIALKAVMIGNIVFHTLGLSFDIYHYSIGVMKLSGSITGLIPHSLLIFGFAYYLLKE
jgi:hypothetical protein